jgi:UDPglucose--hexose-1-phosphate uridylyltransferase
MTRDLERRPHRRQNRLTGEWVLVSPQRMQRPWSGQVDATPVDARPAYDPTCALCPGNRRAGGATNPRYERTFVFDNDFGALLPAGAADGLVGGRSAADANDERFEGDGRSSTDPMLVARPVEGACRVICFSPRHDLALADMDEGAIVSVVETWARETDALGALYPWVQVFENNGTMMGCSNLHPHGQIWASSVLPNEAAKEDLCQREYFSRNGAPLLCDYADREIDSGERVVHADADWIAVVPYWAVWPFELLVLPRRRVGRLPDLTPEERASLARALRQVLGCYDRLFAVSFPYSMGWHGAPYGIETPRREAAANESTRHWQLHAHIFPPLLRSATVRKHMVGYEMLAEPQRDLTPEAAAKTLQALARAASRPAQES